jgi:hypothetical protein
MVVVLSGGARPQLGMSLRGNPTSCFPAPVFFLPDGTHRPRRLGLLRRRASDFAATGFPPYRVLCELRFGGNNNASA